MSKGNDMVQRTLGFIKLAGSSNGVTLAPRAEFSSGSCGLKKTEYEAEKSDEHLPFPHGLPKQHRNVKITVKRIPSSAVPKRMRRPEKFMSSKGFKSCR